MLKLIQLSVLAVYFISPVLLAADHQEEGRQVISQALADHQHVKASLHRPAEASFHLPVKASLHRHAKASASHTNYECSELKDPTAEILGFDMGLEPLELDIRSIQVTTPLRAQVDELKNFTPSVRREVYKAIEILNRLFASEEFNKAIENYKFNGRRQFAKNLKIVNGRKTKPLTNKDIYKLIHMGREERTTKNDGIMNLRLHMVTYLAKTTVAETHLFAAPIAVNKYKYTKYNAKQIAANMMHEWLHNMGFSHSGLTMQSRAHSIPYAIGGIVQKLAHKYL